MYFLLLRAEYLDVTQKKRRFSRVKLILYNNNFFLFVDAAFNKSGKGEWVLVYTRLTEV